MSLVAVHFHPLIRVLLAFDGKLYRVRQGSLFLSLVTNSTVLMGVSLTKWRMFIVRKTAQMAVVRRLPAHTRKPYNTDSVQTMKHVLLLNIN
jgi:hypothetical protein